MKTTGSGKESSRNLVVVTVFSNDRGRIVAVTDAKKDHPYFVVHLWGDPHKMSARVEGYYSTQAAAREALDKYEGNIDEEGDVGTNTTEQA